MLSTADYEWLHDVAVSNIQQMRRLVDAIGFTYARSRREEADRAILHVLHELIDGTATIIKVEQEPREPLVFTNTKSGWTKIDGIAITKKRIDGKFKWILVNARGEQIDGPFDTTKIARTVHPTVSIRGLATGPRPVRKTRGRKAKGRTRSGYRS